MANNFHSVLVLLFSWIFAETLFAVVAGVDIDILLSKLLAKD